MSNARARPRSMAGSTEGRQLPRLCWKQCLGLLRVLVSCPASAQAKNTPGFLLSCRKIMQTAELAAVEGHPMLSQARPQKFPAQRGKSESAQTLHQARSAARVELGEGSGVVLLSTSRCSLLQHEASEPPYPCPAFPRVLPTLRGRASPACCSLSTRTARADVPAE